MALPLVPIAVATATGLGLGSVAGFQLSGGTKTLLKIAAIGGAVWLAWTFRSEIKGVFK